MKYITVLLFCALGFASSCSNMLDQYSHSAIPPEAVTEKDLPALRLGMYNRVQNEPQTRSFIMCDILGGDITQSNYNPIDVINSTLSPLNSAIVNGWNGYYSALYQVNNLLAVTAKFPDSEISVRARGEAHYFRAYIYFCLVSRWGGVPLLRENTLDKLPRSPAADVWGADRGGPRHGGFAARHQRKLLLRVAQRRTGAQGPRDAFAGQNDRGGASG